MKTRPNSDQIRLVLAKERRNHSINWIVGDQRGRAGRVCLCCGRQSARATAKGTRCCAHCAAQAKPSLPKPGPANRRPKGETPFLRSPSVAPLLALCGHRKRAPQPFAHVATARAAQQCSGGSRLRAAEQDGRAPNSLPPSPTGWPRAAEFRARPARPAANTFRHCQSTEYPKRRQLCFAGSTRASPAKPRPA